MPTRNIHRCLFAFLAEQRKVKKKNSNCVQATPHISSYERLQTKSLTLFY